MTGSPIEGVLSEVPPGGLSDRPPQNKKPKQATEKSPPPPPELGNENLAQSLSDRSFGKSVGVVDVRTFGSWISAPKCFFFFLFYQDLTALTEVLGRDMRANDPRMSAGCPKNFLFGLIFCS